MSDSPALETRQESRGFQPPAGAAPLRLALPHGLARRGRFSLTGAVCPLHAVDQK